MNLQNKVAVITGVSKGMGLAILKTLPDKQLKAAGLQILPLLLVLTGYHRWWATPLQPKGKK